MFPVKDKGGWIASSVSWDLSNYGSMEKVGNGYNLREGMVSWRFLVNYCLAARFLGGGRRGGDRMLK